MNKFPTDDLEAYNLVLKGRSFVDKLTKEDYSIAIDLFKQAIALDPNYADAYAELAYTNILSKFIYGDVSLDDEFMKEANENNEIALNLNPNSVRANSTKGLIISESQNEKVRLEAESYFQKALSLNPNDAVSHLEISIYYRDIKKDSQKAMYHARQAFEINPFSVDCFINLANILIENDGIDEAKSLYESKKAMISGELIENYSSFLIDVEAKYILKKGDDWANSIEIYNNAINRSESKLKSNLYQFLGRFYDTYLNDDQNYVYYLKKAIELDSIDLGKIADYYNALLENNQFKEAEQFSKSSIYLNALSENNKKFRQFYYYYHQTKNKEALEILKDSVFDKNVLVKLLLYSQIGDKNKVYELIKNDKPNSNAKAFTFANLKERDSMYFYMDKDDSNAPQINSRREFDLYRKEPRYIEFMKKNYLPILEKYNGKVE